MNCQNCEAPVAASAERCEACGAKLLNRRQVFGAARPEDFNLTPEEPFEFDQLKESEDWQFTRESEIPAFAAMRPEPVVFYGGFFRRGIALMIDGFVLIVLSALMGLLAYVGYKVGLAAHQRSLAGPAMVPLVSLFTAAASFLAMSYFVLFHGREGKTVGKWFLGLRVVGVGNQPIGYGRACLRWIAGVVLAPLLLGFLWVLWSREKRAWHDYLAGTWVIRE
jgi:uncharacterized RDD family membrane protein YckC